MAAAFAICAALFRRARTGKGERLDVAMADVLATWTGTAPPAAAGVDADVRGVPGYGTFATADGGYVALGVVSEDHFWSRLCEVLAVTDVADLGFVARIERLAELQDRIATVLATRSRDEVVAELLAADVPVAPVLSRAEMAALDHFRRRGVIVDGGREPPRTGAPVRPERHPPAGGARGPA
jgi:crotonobetainyl-CoA:carnitine CoA-transferase CaiB-like acyl-CoA transferase